MDGAYKHCCGDQKQVAHPVSSMFEYYLPEQMDGVIAKVYDMLGRLVWIQPLQSSEGQAQTQMQLDKLQAGNYIVLISANKQGGLKYLSHKILIIQ